MKHVMRCLPFVGIAALLVSSLAGFTFANPVATIHNSSPTVGGSMGSAKSAAQPTKVYEQHNLAVDGLVHSFRYDQVCSDGTSGCYTLITVIATQKALSPTSGILKNSVVTPFFNGSEIDVTHTYQTCTGAFGNCSNYTTQQVFAAFYVIKGSQVEGASPLRQYCSTVGWTCQGLGPVSFYASGVSGGTVSYGGQVFVSGDGGGTQTKYADIIMNKDGNWGYHDTCSGPQC